MDKNEVNVSISEIDNGYMLHVAKTNYLSDMFATNRAIVGSKSDQETASALLQALCEEVLFKLMGRTKSFGGEIHGRVNVSVSFTEDPSNPVEMH